MMKRMTKICLDGTEYELPTRVKVYVCPEEKVCCIALCAEAIGLTKKPLNMQTENAAFETWALLLHTYSEYQEVRLRLQDSVALPFWTEEQPFLPGCKGKAEDQEAYGHYNRFLYRVMKFQEQYPWFQVADAGLESAVRRFKTGFGQYLFCNNVPTKPANPPGNWEGRVEAAFAEVPAASHLLQSQAAAQGVKTSKLNRQLPVGLFLEKKSKATQIFTANHSAIDLWGINDDGTKLAIYELKTGNEMPGIITELMFYANYMRDFFVDRNSRCHPSAGGKQRGYDMLLDTCETLTSVYAFMLADGLDKCVTPKILAEMNRNSVGIIYDAIGYEWEKNGETADIANVEKILS